MGIELDCAMTKLTITLLTTVLLFPAFAGDKAPAIAPTWSGIIMIKRNPFQPQPKVESPLLVVNDQKGYQELLTRIPAKQISRTRPAPENNDPLRKAPKIDFTKNTLLVAIRPSMTKPVFQAVESDDKVTTVTVAFPRNQPAARPVHIGVYSALLIPKAKSKIQLKLVNR